MNEKKLTLIIGIVFSIIVGGLYYYIYTPSINLNSASLYWFIGVTTLPFSVSLCILCLEEELPRWVIFTPLIYIIVPVIIFVATTPLFHANEYANRIDVKKAEFSEISQADFTKTPIIDKNGALRLGDKVMGNISEYVSQFTVSDEYTQISYQDSIYRVTPLEYAGFIKYFTNKDEGIPAYIKVNCVTGKAELVKLKDLGLKGMKYVPSAKFNDNLQRKLQFTYPGVIFGSPSFEIDEKGHPYYICTTYSYKGIGNKKTVTGLIIFNPIDGSSKQYDLDKVPSWVDRVYPENLITKEFDDFGKYQKGFWNSIIGQSGVIETSEGYSYIEKDGDIWYYSGITSSTSDESNLGFILVNLRTHEALQIPLAGANEASAMRSAESEVKNYGYTSTFPLLLNIKGNPTYLMSLNNNSIIKMYAMVSAVDYQKVAVVNSEETLDDLTAKYIEVLGSDNADKTKEEVFEASLTVADIETFVIDGNSLVYLNDNEGNLYQFAITNESVKKAAFIKPNDVLNIKYTQKTDIRIIKDILK